MSSDSLAMSSSAENSVEFLVQKFAKISDGLSSSDLSDLSKVAACLAVFLHSRSKKLILDTPEQPVCLQFGADCTPVKLRTQVSHKHGRTSAQLVGRKALEIYVQEVFVSTYLSSGEKKHMLVLREPLVLRHGKSMQALLAATLRNFPAVDLLCGTGNRICISHMCLDRGMSPSFRQAMSGHWIAEQASRMASISDHDPHQASLLTWHTSLPCACHDAHNSLMRAHATLFSENADLLKSLYVSIQVYKQCSVSVLSCIVSWYGRVLQGRPDQDLPPTQALADMYTALGAAPPLVEFLSAEAGLFWEDSSQQLVVKASFLDRPACVQDLTANLLQCYHFDTFTTSRWCTVGTSSRQLTLAMCTGYLHLFDHMQQTGCISTYESGQGLKLSVIEKRFAVTIGLVSHVPDAFLAFSLGENRLAKFPEAAMQTVLIEQEYLESLPLHVWQRLATFVQWTATELRDHVISGVLVSTSYLHIKVFDALQDLPWSLCSNPGEKLEALRALQAPPQDPVAAKIWSLLQIGYPMPQLLKGLELLSSCTWTTSFTEKLHASSSLCRRHHPDYSENTHSARSFVHSCRIAK